MKDLELGKKSGLQYEDYYIERDKINSPQKRKEQEEIARKRGINY